MKNLLLCGLWILLSCLIGCNEKEVQSKDTQRIHNDLQDRLPKNHDSIFVDDLVLQCGECNRDVVLVVKSPFKRVPLHVESVELNPGAALLSKDFEKVERENAPKTKNLYVRHLQLARDNGAPLFFGTIRFLVEIETDGKVKSAVIKTSDTQNLAFDEALRKSILEWNFPKAKSKTVAEFPITFRKTGFSGNFVQYSEILF